MQDQQTRRLPKSTEMKPYAFSPMAKTALDELELCERATIIEMELTRLYSSQGKTLGSGSAVTRAGTLTEALADVPIDDLEKLFLWCRENCEDIPKDRGFRKIWYENKRDIQNYRARAFMLPPDETIKPTKSKPLSESETRMLMKKYPNFAPELEETLKGDRSQPDHELFARIAQKIQKEFPMSTMTTVNHKHTEPEEDNIGAWS